MKVTVKHIFTGKEVTRELNITIKQLEAWQNGAKIQDVMPHLSPSDREFLMTGLSDEEWDDIIRNEE